MLLYPLMLAKTRLQIHYGREDGCRKNNKNMVKIWREIIQREGIRGLYQGLEAQVTKGFVSQGVTMVVKQR